MKQYISELKLKLKRLQLQYNRRGSFGGISLDWDVETGEINGKIQTYREVVKKLESISR